jgi:hypothetical protein
VNAEPSWDWVIDGGELLSRPDPGPTPWLIEDLVVDQSIAAIVGRWKTTKSWAALDCGICVCTGQAAFGTHHVPDPGPVVYVIEESGEEALQRRLAALCRGRGLHPDDLRGRLLLAPNRGVKLDSPDWQARLIELGHGVRPRAFIFDPLARMKNAARIENDQTDMAPLIEYLRLLRDETHATALFVHHTGHQGDHMRGSSDLESAWESRLAFRRDPDTRLVTVQAEHREAGEDDHSTVAYELAWDSETRTMRLRSTQLPTDQRCIDWLSQNAPATTDEIAKGVNIRRSDVKRTMDRLKEAGTAERSDVPRSRKDGRHITVSAWILSNQARLSNDPAPSDNGTAQDGGASDSPNPFRRPAPLGADGDGGRGGTAQTPIPGDNNLHRTLAGEP